MTGNNPKLGLVNVDMNAKFSSILSSHSQEKRKRNVHRMTEPRNYGITESRKDRVNPKRGYNDGQQSQARFFNVDVHTKFGQILSNHSKDIERKQNSDINQGP